MYNKKYGFTLAEVLIVLMVIGIIMAMSIPVISAVNTSYTQSTYTVYKNLQAAVTQMMSGSPHPYKNGAGIDDVTIGFGISDIQTNDGYLLEREDPNDETSRTRNLLYSCRTGNGKNLTLIRPGKILWNMEFPSVDTDGNTLQSCSELQNSASLSNEGNMFCRALAGLSNVGSGKNADRKYYCSQSADSDNELFKIEFATSGDHAGEPIIVPENIRPAYYKKHYNAYCLGAGTCKNPNFVSSNGQLYFISEWAKVAGDDYGFRLVAVDLNGYKGPNVTLGADGNYVFVGGDASGRIKNKFTGKEIAPKATGKIPDIVTFIVWDNGEVYPLGVAADDYKFNDGKKDRRVLYLPSEAKGYDFSSGVQSDVPVECTYGENDPKRDKLAPGGCNYNRVNIGQDLKEPMTFRQAYCTAFGQKEDSKEGIAFNYCDNVNLPTGITDNECPRVPGIKTGVYDFCKVEPIKPIFKFNMD